MNSSVISDKSVSDRKQAYEKKHGQFIYGASIGLKSNNRLEVIQSLKKGFPVQVFDKLQKQFDVPANTLAAVINIAPRTLTRRKKEGRFHTDESERLLRVARLYDRAVELFGDPEIVRHWFKSPKRALNGITPLEFADTEPGAQEVEDLLGRLGHGIFS